MSLAPKLGGAGAQDREHDTSIVALFDAVRNFPHAAVGAHFDHVQAFQRVAAAVLWICGLAWLHDRAAAVERCGCGDRAAREQPE